MMARSQARRAAVAQILGNKENASMTDTTRSRLKHLSALHSGIQLLTVHFIPYPSVIDLWHKLKWHEAGFFVMGYFTLSNRNLW